MRLPSWRTQLLAFTLVVILATTLWPVYDAEPRRLLACIVCGVHAVSDVLLNVALFVPFGVALAVNARPLTHCVLAAALLSASVEFAQLYIPGRDSSLGDVLSNTLGATLGALLLRTAPSWLQPSSRRASALSRTAALAAVAVCCGTGLLLTPAFPDSVYYGMWTPRLGHLKWYQGRVEDATIGALHIARARMPDSPLARELLSAANGFSLHVRAVAGPRTPGLAPLFAIYDDRQREIILLGPDRDDLVFRFRTRAAVWRMDQPDIRLVGGMGRGGRLSPGDALDVTVTGRRGAYRIVLNDRTSSTLGPTVGSGWALLLYPESLPAALMTALCAIWVGALFLPAGFWTRTRGDTVWAGAALAAGLIGAPLLTPLVATPAIQWAAAAAGLVAGAGLRVLCSRKLFHESLERYIAAPR
jgi:VanZ family protein